MKFSIKLKIVALGAFLSILVTSVAIIFSNVQFKNRQEKAVINTIDNCLGSTQEIFTDPTNKDRYLSNLEATKKYILDCYSAHPEEPTKDLSLKDEKLFYKNYFGWLYQLEGLSMYHMEDEEYDFRSNYQLLTNLVAESKRGARSEKAYLAFLTDDDKLFYMADEYSYTVGTFDGMIFPGSRMSKFPGKFVKNGDYYDCNFNQQLNRVLPIINEDNETISYLFIEYSFDDVDKEVDSLVKTETIVLSITSVGMIVAFALGAHFLFLKNVSKLNKSASSFTENLKKGSSLKAKDPKIKSRDEIEELSKSFVALEEGIIKYIDVIQQETKEKERTNAELSVAANIQLGALPSDKYDDEKVTIRAFIKSAKEVGGDFYDYFYLDENRLAVIISDVSGKGIPASLFMMKSKELLKSTVRTHSNLVEAVTEVNKMLSTNNNELLFVTSFVGIIDFEKEEINFVNAGHEKPYIVSNEKVRKLEGESNFVMGGEESFIYKEEKAKFSKGEYLFMFTDGLNESINHANEEFSYERIEQVLDQNKESAPEEIIKTMHAALKEFVEDKEQFDDVTMLVVKNHKNELTLSYEEKDYKIISDIVDKLNANFSFMEEETRSKAGIVIDELINNLISYEKREDLKIDVKFVYEKEKLTIEIKCNGNDYNPFANHKEKYLESFHPAIEEGGFGLSIIKDLAKSYKYEYKDRHSIVKIVL